MLRIVLGYSGLHPSVYTGENQSNYGTFKNAEDLHWEAQAYTLPQSTWVDHCGFCHTHQVSERPLLILVTEILLKTIVQSDLQLGLKIIAYFSREESKKENWFSKENSASLKYPGKEEINSQMKVE